MDVTLQDVLVTLVTLVIGFLGIPIIAGIALEIWRRTAPYRDARKRQQQRHITTTPAVRRPETSPRFERSLEIANTVPNTPPVEVVGTLSSNTRSSALVSGSNLTTEKLLPLLTWLARANLYPDKTPHLAVTGPSGSGKTTLVLAILDDRPGTFVICTPKSKKTDPWGGFPATRLRKSDMSFEPIGAAIMSVYNEMLRRNAHDADVEEDWITLVIDEYSTVIGKLPKLKEIVLDMVTLGRSSRIRIVILATETNVEAWGWKGRGEARHNCLFIECEEDTHRAWMYRWEKPRAEVDTALVYSIAASADLSERAWSFSPERKTDADEYLSNLLDLVQDVPVHGDVLDFGGIPAVTSDVPGDVPPDGLDDEVIKALHSAGWSMNKIAAKMAKGNKQQRLARIRQAIQVEAEEEVIDL